MRRRRCCEFNGARVRMLVSNLQTHPLPLSFPFPSLSCSLSPPSSHSYKIADSFISLPQPRVLSLLEKETSRLDEEIEALKSRVDECEEEMKKLKVVLYGKFGSNISESKRVRDVEGEI
jgi:hypothetical protein